MKLKVGDIVINKDPYKGETPYKIIAEVDECNFVRCANFDRETFEFDNNFCSLKHLEDFNYYEKIENFDLWLKKNKENIIWRSNVWYLERSLSR